MNGLFWGYHWLRKLDVDLLYRVAPEDQLASYEVMGAGITRWSCIGPIDRSCRCSRRSHRAAARFPDIANAFDNLHMLHDMVNDILATEWMTDAKREQITRAVWLVLCRRPPRGEAGIGLRTGCDHRFFAGMPGMGIMKGDPGADVDGGHGLDEHAGLPPLQHAALDQGGGVAKSDGHRRRLGDARRCALCARLCRRRPGRAISSFRRKIRMNCSSSSRTSRET